MEGIETDTYRQGDLRIGHRDADGRQLLGEETQVFEGAEDEDIPRQSRDECPAACSSRQTVDTKSCQVVHQYAEQHQEHINRLTPGIEDQREEHQNRILQRMAAL